MEAQTLRAVSQISARLVRIPGRHGDLNSLLQHIAEVALEAFAADACVILAFNPLTEGFIGSQIVVGDLQVKDEWLHNKPRPKGVTQQVLQEGVVLVGNLEEKLEGTGGTAEPWYQNRFLMEEGIRSFAGLAMRTRHRHKPLGVIYLDYRQLRSFTPADRESFQLFAVQAGLLLQEAWLENHLEEVARIGQEINHDLATVDDLFQHLQTYVDAILDDSHMLMLAIYQPQSNTADIHVRAHGTYTFMNRPLGGATKYIIESQEAFSIQHLSEEKDRLPFQIVNVTGTKEREALIFVPLTLRDLPLGVLSIQHPLPNTYGQEDLFILQLLANYIALALHNMRLYRSLTQLNETGQLLTSQLESEQTLQATVDKIRAAAQADLVVLYAFDAPSHRFVLPPRIAGTMLDTTFPRVTRLRPNDITTKALSCAEPIFAKESMSVYTELGGQAQIRPGNFREREKIASIALLPLRVGDESVGVLFVNFRQAQRFDATQKLLIEGLAHYAAISIKNSQVFGSLSLRRVRELEILQKIDRELAHTLELDTVLNTILRLTRRQVSADEASIALYNAQAQVLESIATLGQHASERHNLNIPVQDLQGITRWVLEHKGPALVANVQLDPQWKDVYVQTTGTTLSALHVPLLDGDEVVGVMSFESSKEGAFHQEDQDFLLTLAGQTILAIKTAQAYEREKRLADERQVLNDISKEITSQLDYVRIFNLILDKALALTHSTVGSVHLYDPDSRTLNMEAERGVGEERKRLRQQLGEGIVGRVAKRRELLSVNDVTRSPWNEFFVEFFPGTRSELTVPMLAGDELRGVLNVESPHPNNYTGRDKRLLQGLADLAVVALQNAQAFEGEKRLVAEGKVLNDISKEITSQLDHVRVFDLILEKTLELTHSTLGELMLYDSNRNELWIAAGQGMDEHKKHWRFPLEQGIVGRAATSRQLLNVEDVSRPPWNAVYVPISAETRSELAVPMLAGNELRGVLNVESSELKHFDKGNERLLQGLADLAVVALQNAERYKQAEIEANRFKLLNQAGQELGKIADMSQLDQAYEIILRTAEQQSHSLVVIRRYDKETQELEVIRASQPDYVALHRRMKLDEGINGQVARERRRILIDDIHHPPTGVVIAQPSDVSTLSRLIIPILLKEEYYGNLGLSHKDIGHFKDADIDFFEGLANQLASTIHRLETVEARKESEQRAKSVEVMGTIGQMAFEFTHRWDNGLGLVDSYINDIQAELESLGVCSQFIVKKLDNIAQATHSVLDFSKVLKQEFVRSGEATDATVLHPNVLFEKARSLRSLPPTIEMHTRIEEDVSMVEVIPNLFTDILYNLVSNAIDAMPNGGKIVLRARNDGKFVALSISDTGSGITEQHISKVFDLFYSTKGSYGFGLWSARRNALRNHGDLLVESEPGKGTTFTLLLPRVN